MRRIVGCSLLCMAMTPLAASASSYVLDIVPEKGQISRYDEGREVVQDDLPNSSVRIFEPKDKLPRRAGFRLYVFNGSGAPINFGPENVTIILGDGTRVAMVTYKQLMAEEHKREVWQGIAIALGNASRSIAASQAGNTYGTATYSGRTSGPYGSSTTTGTATYNGYNPGAAYAAQANADAQNNAAIADFAYSQAAAKAAINSTLQMQTVDPGTSFGGVVQYDMPKPITKTKTPVPITIEVRIGEEVHLLHGTLTKS